MYYNIATDLKEIFQRAKDTDEKEDGLPQNEACGGEKAKAAHSPAALVTGAERPGMFMFSFFESDTKAVNEGTFFFLFHCGQFEPTWWSVYIKCNDLTLAEEISFQSDNQYEIQYIWPYT